MNFFWDSVYIIDNCDAFLFEHLAGLKSYKYDKIEKNKMKNKM